MSLGRVDVVIGKIRLIYNYFRRVMQFEDWRELKISSQSVDQAVLLDLTPYKTRFILFSLIWINMNLVFIIIFSYSIYYRSKFQIE